MFAGRLSHGLRGPAGVQGVQGVHLEDLDPQATRSLFVGNIQKNIGVYELQDIFSQFGNVLVSAAAILFTIILLLFVLFLSFFFFFNDKMADQFRYPILYSVCVKHVLVGVTVGSKLPGTCTYVRMHFVHEIHT